jgi:phosphonopyruvate decarboxylase
MIATSDFLAALRANDVRFVTGVPDSLLKDVCAAITVTLPPSDHVIAANEGAAVGLALGHYLASGRPALVYLQNSGLGNAVNPLASLADPAVYGIPMVLMIGWRGEMLADGSQLKDEPQHKLQGRITLGQLDVLAQPWRVVDANSDITADLAWAVSEALAAKRPVALVVRKGTFETCKLAATPEPDAPTREAAIAAVLAALPETAAVVSTTGMASREVFELRKAAGAGHARDFLTVGGMGHAVSIASGIARTQPQRRVVCVDGDGAMLMHLGALTESARQPNLLHIVLNNGAHDSVGGQPTAATRLDLQAIAAACGYARTAAAETLAAIGPAVAEMLTDPDAGFLEVRCRRGARADLGRPTRSPAENKDDFMRFLANP